MKAFLFTATFLTVFTVSASAQTSASYKLEESVFNAGGNPSPELKSASFKITLDAIGEGVAATGLSSVSYQSDAGFPPYYPPPGEVSGPRFTSKTTLVWDPDPSVGRYDIYRGTSEELPGTFGTCLAGGIGIETIEATEDPIAGQCYFYLVTAENRLAEEGTKGYTSSGSERTNTIPCP